MNIPVFNFNGEKIREDNISNFFELESINDTLIWEIITAGLAAIRQGNHKTKTKGEVRGGGKKPWKQKGTGRARAGSNRSPIWVGGGIVFGPSPRSYKQDIPKKKKKRAIQHIVSNKIKENQLIFLDSISVEKINTSFLNEKMHSIVNNSPFVSKAFPKKNTVKSNKNKKKILLITEQISQEILISTKNIPWINYQNVMNVSALHLFYNNGIIITTQSFEKLEKRLHF